MRELLVREAHGGGLMYHFGVRKPLDVLHEHFFWPKMKCDVERACARCITCREIGTHIGMKIHVSVLWKWFMVWLH